MKPLLCTAALAIAFFGILMAHPAPAAAWTLADCQKIHFQHPDCIKFIPTPAPPDGNNTNTNTNTNSNTNNNSNTNIITVKPVNNNYNSQDQNQNQHQKQDQSQSQTANASLNSSIANSLTNVNITPQQNTLPNFALGDCRNAQLGASEFTDRSTGFYQGASNSGGAISLAVGLGPKPASCVPNPFATIAACAQLAAAGIVLNPV